MTNDFIEEDSLLRSRDFSKVNISNRVAHVKLYLYMRKATTIRNCLLKFHQGQMSRSGKILDFEDIQQITSCQDSSPHFVFVSRRNFMIFFLSLDITFSPLPLFLGGSI